MRGCSSTRRRKAERGGETSAAQAERSHAYLYTSLHSSCFSLKSTPPNQTPLPPPQRQALDQPTDCHFSLQCRPLKWPSHASTRAARRCTRVLLSSCRRSSAAWCSGPGALFRCAHPRQRGCSCRVLVICRHGDAAARACTRWGLRGMSERGGWAAAWLGCLRCG
jgi:hypothetical protein